MRSKLFTGMMLVLTAGSASAQTPTPTAPAAMPAANGAIYANAGQAPVVVVDSGIPSRSGVSVWVTADYMAMWYTPMGTPPLIQAVPSAQVSAPSSTGTITLFPENNRLNFGVINGFRASTGMMINDRFGFDVGGFVLQKQAEGASVFNDGTPFSVAQGYIAAGSGIPTSLFASVAGEYSGGVAAFAESQLWGAEVNVRCAWYSLCFSATDILAGFRYLDLEESLSINSPSTFPNGNTITVQDIVRTDNQFYGGQLGFNCRLGGFERGFGAEFTIKGAIGSVAQRAELIGSNTVIAGGVTNVEAGGLYARGANFGTFTRDKGAYLQDVDLKLTYNFTRWVQVSFGYSLIYLSSVIRPGNAIDPVVNDSDIRFVANPTPSTLDRPAFGWRAEELVVQGMTFGFRVQY